MSRWKKVLAATLIAAIIVPTMVFQTTDADENVEITCEVLSDGEQTQEESESDDDALQILAGDSLEELPGGENLPPEPSPGSENSTIGEMLGSVTPGDYDDPDEYMERHDDYDFLNDGTLATASDVKNPTTKNKKGIQGFSWLDSAGANDLGVNHVFINLDLNEIVSDKTTAYNYTYKGKTYYFTDRVHNYAKVLHDKVRPRNIAVTGQILLGNPYKVGPFIPGTKTPSKPNNKVATKLVFPGAKDNTTNHYYYGLNTTNQESRDILEACIHYIVENFNKKDTFIQNWIIGNEVDVPLEYNYIGTTSQTANVDAVYGAYKILYNVVRESSPNSKTYVCFTNHWNDNCGGQGIPVRDFLDEFAYNCKRDGIGWNVAYHAYNPELGQNMWSETNRKRIAFNENSPFVTAANLNILTDYIKNHYGTSHRVILTEQGYEAINSGCSATTQAAELAYLYNAVARNDMIDCMHYALWKDDNNEALTGLHIGLLDMSGNPREAYNVFKDMDRNPSSTDKYKSVLKITKWTDVPYNMDADEGVKITSLNVRPATQQSNPEDKLLEPGKLYFYMEPTLNNGVLAEKWNLEYKWTVAGKVVKDYTSSGRILRLESVPNDPIEIVAECRTFTGNSYMKYMGIYMPQTNQLTPIFEDVDYSSWYASFVNYVVQNGIMAGTAGNRFAPKDLCTREQMIQILYNASGKPGTDVSNPFSDNIPGKWYYKAVLWGSSRGVTSGIGGGKFGVGGNVTREQMAGFLYNYAASNGREVSQRADLSGFTDSGNVSGWARESMSWANACGIINGKGNGILDPRGTATRAEVAAMICNFNNVYGR